MSAEPLIKDRISEEEAQDKDGIVRRRASLSTCPLQEGVGQVVEAADDGVLRPSGGAVAKKTKKKAMKALLC